jgi:hypothetical protein
MLQWGMDLLAFSALETNFPADYIHAQKPYYYTTISVQKLLTFSPLYVILSIHIAWGIS